ncbi:alanine racemase [Haloferula sargassicola]|uniref:Alanine racemase n=1 Tax=Haloferula sargassicola TaxID=490096 RepID=A0ABP9UNF8_9BACT
MHPVSPPRAWAEIELSALKHNLEVARERSGCRVMAVLKAGAYGHGLEEIARFLATEEVAFFGVANVGEARRIADAGVSTPIYLLGATWAGEREEIVDRGWVPCLSTLDEARHFSDLATAAGKKLTCHISVDTGMGRGGFLPADLPAAMPHLDAMPGLVIDGIGSHLPSADEDEAFTRGQAARFAEIVGLLGGAERFRWIHLGNSAGLLGYDRGPCNLARPGLMLYGISPLPGHGDALRNVMTLKSRVSVVRQLPAGHGVSYGRAFVTTRPTAVATVGIGYGDGYPRHLSGQGAEVVIRSRRFPLLGRVTMDQIMVDVTGSDVAPGDEVELFGPNIRVDEIAQKAGTIAWEILTGITPRVTRIHL